MGERGFRGAEDEASRRAPHDDHQLQRDLHEPTREDLEDMGDMSPPGNEKPLFETGEVKVVQYDGVRFVVLSVASDRKTIMIAPEGAWLKDKRVAGQPVAIDDPKLEVE